MLALLCILYFHFMWETEWRWDEKNGNFCKIGSEVSLFMAIASSAQCRKKTAWTKVLFLFHDHEHDDLSFYSRCKFIYFVGYTCILLVDISRSSDGLETRVLQTLVCLLAIQNEVDLVKRTRLTRRCTYRQNYLHEKVAR